LPNFAECFAELGLREIALLRMHVRDLGATSDENKKKLCYILKKVIEFIGGNKTEDHIKIITNLRTEYDLESAWGANELYKQQQKTEQTPQYKKPEYS
jgi:hypothetical protein